MSLPENLRLAAEAFKAALDNATDDERQAMRAVLEEDYCLACWSKDCTGWCDYDSVWD